MMLPSRVAIAVSLHHIFEAGERVVVAVSGGPDSLALLSVLREIVPAFPLHLTVAHFDHPCLPDSPTRHPFVPPTPPPWGHEHLTPLAATDTRHTENSAPA